MCRARGLDMERERDGVIQREGITGAEGRQSDSGITG